MASVSPNDIFTDDVLQKLLPPQISDLFFEALYGDADEGVYDISLAFKDYEADGEKLSFELVLRERTDRCLACNLTFGLPQVFTRHPVINIQGMVEKIVALLGDKTRSFGWELGRTREESADIHVIPLTIWLG